jgi:DNA-binding NtrC family response regulator
MSHDSPRILVIDDERTTLDFLKQALPDFGLDVVAIDNGPEGIERYKEERFDLVLVDVMMPEIDGFELIRRLQSYDKEVMAIVMTGASSIKTAVQAMKVGAVDYLTKPLDLDHLEVVLLRTLENRKQNEKIRLLEEQVNQNGSFEGLVGVSQQMQKIYGMIRQVAENDATVLIQGETGTGKEMIAKAVHRRSQRRDGNFLPVNCGALPESILESELFGHEKGSFTGAVGQKQGLIEQASGGTFFLDEVQEMTQALQVKLLRTIQEREIRRVGGSESVKVDFRLVAATNIDLRQQMEEKTFRADLYYRLSVVVIDLPPLRERQEDIPLLVNHFLADQDQAGRRPVREITPEAMMVLKAYGWPGNVRELENTIEQAVLLSKGDVISVGDLPSQIMGAVFKDDGNDFQGMDWFDMPLREAREQFERQYLEEILKKVEGNVSAAARLAGINRQHFYQKMRRHGMSRK